jgi:hypothetical protein
MCDDLGWMCGRCFYVDFCVRFLPFALDLQGRRHRLDGFHGGEIDWVTGYTLNFAWN